jgi:hypothetical protein
MDNAAKSAIEALKATAPSNLSPLPWEVKAYTSIVRDVNDDRVAEAWHERDAAHIAAAVNAAPHLLARVAELEAALEAARVAVGSVRLWHQTGCDAESFYCKAPCNCNVRHIATARLALGLEVTK